MDPDRYFGRHHKRQRFCFAHALLESGRTMMTLLLPLIITPNVILAPSPTPTCLLTLLYKTQALPHGHTTLSILKLLAVLYFSTQSNLCTLELVLQQRMGSSEQEQEQQQQQHILVVTYRLQGHINPCLHLARQLSSVTTGTRITFSTTVSAHRLMFSPLATPDQEVDDGLISYIPFSDGYDNGFSEDAQEARQYLATYKVLGPKNLSAIVDDLAARGRPVTCIVYSLLLSWAADVARQHGIPSALYWIQPATVFATYYHYFHGYESLVASHSKDPSFVVNFPGLPPLKIRDLPSFLTNSDSDDSSCAVLTSFRELFETLERRDDSRSKPRVIINTFHELEVDALTCTDQIDLIPAGPVLPFLITGNKDAKAEADTTGARGNLFRQDEKGYMEWLDSKPKGSVVYVSFGSISTIKKRQMEEIQEGLKESGRPYLWVVRKDNREEGVDLGEDGEAGMVVEWCSQVDVLSHPSVGCFVTHCGWNSTLESVACGVPLVCVPQWTDQGTNAWLATTAWGTGVPGELDSEGVLPGRELSRCLEMVMGEGETGVEIRRSAMMWRERALKAVRDGGSSDRNLKAFVKGI